ncbi:MAG: 2OG-Fe(II) oxygenase [Novosphingobium sp.]
MIDGFLPASLAQGLLEHAWANQADFRETGVVSDGADVVDRADRRSLRLPAGLGMHEADFVNAVHAILPAALEKLGAEAFDLAQTETELAAHGDGAFYNIHVDTLTQHNREGRDTDRVLSGVWYAHRVPAGFIGGELALHPFGPGEPALIEPRHNRLVLFSSIAPHAVRPVACASGDFADYRFAVNCWLHRARPVG